MGGEGLAALGLGEATSLAKSSTDGLPPTSTWRSASAPASGSAIDSEGGPDGVDGDSATSWTRCIASSRPVAVETAGCRSGSCWRSHSASASSWPPSPGRITQVAGPAGAGGASGSTSASTSSGVAPRLHGDHERAAVAANEVHGGPTYPCRPGWTFRAPGGPSRPGEVVTFAPGEECSRSVR